MNWPTLLPNPSVNFNGVVKSSSRRTEMESGRFRQYPRFTTEYRQYNVVWEFSDFEYGMFQSWVKYKINRGNDAFTISLPTGGEALKEVSAKIVNGDYNADHISSSVLYWRVSAILEVEEALVWTEEIFDILSEVGSQSELAAVANDLHILINTKFPA